MYGLVAVSRHVMSTLIPLAGGPAIPTAVPWALFAGAIAIAVLRDQLKALLTWIVRGVANRVYARFAGSPLLRRAALKKYTAEVFRKYEFFIVPFVDNLRLPMREVYVPLEAQQSGFSDGLSRDAYAELRSTRRSVVIGVPGAGKSMLLRQTMFAWADAHCDAVERRRMPWSRTGAAPKRLRVRIGRRTETPVLVELHRMNAAGTDIVTEIVAQFRRNGFPNADRFVQGALRGGRLTVLLDGLDEVSTSHRSAVVKQILDFADEHEPCRLAVTCREAVYQGQLAEQVTMTMRVADFDERLIRQFLYGWPRLRHAGALDQLMSALRETPQLMQLAGNPLLLTMIAFLYTATSTRAGRTLPHTRAEFYKQVTDDLLEQRWHQDQNSFAGAKKKAVLLQLALLAHERYGGSQDRIALPADVVLDEIGKRLPNLNYDPSQADDMLEEIVSRSGLLLRIDGGERYQFAHQTLQEYLAAVALHSEQQKLLDLHEKDPHLWREVVRLWCGSVSQDSGDVIEKVFERDPLLAFECLADAQNVRSDLADSIIGYFEERLDDGSQVIASFGLVASDRRPRGRRVFDFLAETMRGDLSPGSQAWPASALPRGYAAASALAATHLPDAVALLMEFADDTLVQSCLVSMGDLAVPTLSRMPLHGNGAAARILGRIGTPAAMIGLVPFLCGSKVEAATAAHYLAVRLADSQIEAALGTMTLSTELRASERLTWVWSPFSRGADDPLVVIAGRVAQILDASGPQPQLTDAGCIDPRIGIPLSTVRLVGEWSRPTSIDLPQSLVDELEAMQTPTHVRPLAGRGDPAYLSNLSWEPDAAAAHSARGATPTVEERSIMAQAVLKVVDFPDRRIALFAALAPEVQLRLIGRIFAVDFLHHIRLKDWEGVRRIPRYAFRKGWHYRVILAIAMAAWGGAIWAALAAAIGWHPWGPAWLGWAALAAIPVGLLTWLTDGFERDRSAWDVDLFDPGSFAVVHTGPTALIAFADGFWGGVRIIPANFFGPAIFLYGYVCLADFMTPGVVLLTIGLLVLLVAWLIWAGLRRDREARNPLYGLLPGTASENRE